MKHLGSKRLIITELGRAQGNRLPPSRLMERETATTPLGETHHHVSSVKVNRFLDSNSSLRYLLKRNENTQSHKDLYKKIHSTFIRDSKSWK